MRATILQLEIEFLHLNCTGTIETGLDKNENDKKKPDGERTNEPMYTHIPKISVQRKKNGGRRDTIVRMREKKN